MHDTSIIRYANGKKFSLQKYSWKGNAEPEITACLIGNLFLRLIPAETAVIPGGPPSHLIEPEQVLKKIEVVQMDLDWQHTGELFLVPNVGLKGLR